MDCSINVMSNKVYSVVGVSSRNKDTNQWEIRFVHKKVGTHTDMEFDKAHDRPVDNNSQKPMTPVLIVMFGDTKYLDFV